MSAQPTLIVADDEPMMRQLLSQTLVSLGFRVLTAENGVEAFELVAANAVDLVISDVNMPKGGGVKLVENLKNSPHAAIPVILMTGDADQMSIAGLDGVKILRKPFRRQELVELIRSILPPAKT